MKTVIVSGLAGTGGPMCAPKLQADRFSGSQETESDDFADSRSDSPELVVTRGFDDRVGCGAKAVIV